MIANSRTSPFDTMRHVIGRRIAYLALACVALDAESPLHAQGARDRGPLASQWALALTGGGSYAMSDLEIVPGTDQNGGWGFDAGLRAQHGRASLGVGYERLRFATTLDGTATASGAYAEPRFDLSRATRGALPYLFAHGGRIFDYAVDICCSVYRANAIGHGWLVGGGFGVLLAPAAPIRFDISAGVHQLSGKSRKLVSGTWESAGPMIDVRFGASLPLLGSGAGSK